MTVTPTPDAHQRILALDGLRGMAALIVVVSHVSNTTLSLGGLLGSGAGQIGVMIFFALSGYLMGALYLDRPFRPSEIAAYVVHRVARVAPLYYLVVAVSFVLTTYLAIAIAYPIDAENLWQHLALVQGVDVLWTIPVEMQFYTVFILLWALRAFSAPLFLIACLALLAVPTVFTHGPGNWAFTLPRSIAFFSAGALLSRVVRPNNNPGAIAAAFWSAAFVVALALTFILYPKVYNLLTAHEAGNTWLSPLYLAVIALLLATTVKAPLATLVLGSRIPAFLGAISYSVYLLHIPILHAVGQTSLNESPASLLTIVVCLTILAATVSHFILERPARKIINGMWQTQVTKIA